MTSNHLPEDPTDEIDQLLRRLFPLNRSLTGPGNLETLAVLGEIVPLNILQYPTGSAAFDWRIPQEWSVRQAWIKDGAGRKIVDFDRCNLHLMGYSEPVRGRFSFQQLEGHLHYIEDLPDAVPYRTSYYRRDWAFCVSHTQYLEMKSMDGEFEVCIDSEFKDGALSVGEALIPGRSPKEILISTYFCHPSMANDNLSGVILTALLARQLKSMSLEYSYRIVFVPETIGAIAYCANNADAMRDIDAGLVVTCTGGPGPLYYKQSLDHEHHINTLVEEVLRDSGEAFLTYPFDIHGSDERQYSSPGFRINTVTIGRNRYYEYPYYHTSLDNLDYVKPGRIAKTLATYLQVIAKLDGQVVLRNRMPDCEVMLSRHDLYPKTGGALNFSGAARDMTELDVILWLLALCDGRMPLSRIAARLNVAGDVLRTIAADLVRKGVLEPVAGRI